MKRAPARAKDLGAELLRGLSFGVQVLGFNRPFPPGKAGMLKRSYGERCEPAALHVRKATAGVAPPRCTKTHAHGESGLRVHVEVFTLIHHTGVAWRIGGT